MKSFLLSLAVVSTLLLAGCGPSGPTPPDTAQVVLESKANANTLVRVTQHIGQTSSGAYGQALIAAQALLAEADGLESRGDQAGAQQKRIEAFQISNQSSGRDGRDIIKALSLLSRANAYQRQSASEDADKLFQEALQVGASSSGYYGRDLIKGVTLVAMADAAEARDNRALAAQLRSQALDVAAGSSGNYGSNAIIAAVYLSQARSTTDQAAAASLREKTRVLANSTYDRQGKARILAAVQLSEAAAADAGGNAERALQLRVSVYVLGANTSGGFGRDVIRAAALLSDATKTFRNSDFMIPLMFLTEEDDD